MSLPIYVYDPTATDEESKVRGVGRYLQTLYENFSPKVIPAQARLAEASGEAQAGISKSAEIPDHVRNDETTFHFTSKIEEIPVESIFINPFFNIIQKPLHSKRIAQKQIAVIHDLIPLKYPQYFPIGLKGKWYSFLSKLALKNYDLIITDSIASKRDIVRLLKLPQEKIKVIYPTIAQIFLPHVDTGEQTHHPFHKEQEGSVAEYQSLPLEKVILPENIQQLNDFIVYVGDGTWNKNLPTLAKAVKLANVSCVCVGKVFTQDQTTKYSPWLYSLQAFLNETKNDPHFIFPGFVDDVTLLALYKKARLNILPSIDEGFGLSFLEAGMTSTPSVLADTEVFREIALDNALFAKTDDPKEFAQKIAGIYHDKLGLEKLGIKSFSRAEDFHPDVFKARWVEILSELT